MADQNGDKTQDATPRRREQAREKGQIPFSQDLGSAAILVVAVVALMMLGGEVIIFFGKLLQRQLGGAATLTANRDYALNTFDIVFSGLTSVMLPILGVLFIAGVLISLVQTGILFTPSRIAPDISRLNPISGLKRIFSIAGVMKIGFGLFKILIVAIVASVVIYLHREEILSLAGLEISQISTYLPMIVLKTALWCGGALLLLALMDFAFQKWKHEQDLKMTQQEVRDEMKEMQGDPLIAARRRAIQRQMVMNRMSDAVPKADVVVTNPTELSIAIQYDPTSMASPIVVAKGAGVLAQRIRKLALENNIPIVERKPLARLLYKEVELNHPIPDDSFAAVAEVLAYVYQLKGKKIPGAA